MFLFFFWGGDSPSLPLPHQGKGVGGGTTPPPCPGHSPLLKGHRGGGAPHSLDAHFPLPISSSPRIDTRLAFQPTRGVAPNSWPQSFVSGQWATRGRGGTTPPCPCHTKAGVRGGGAAWPQSLVSGQWAPASLFSITKRGGGRGGSSHAGFPTWRWWRNDPLPHPRSAEYLSLACQHTGSRPSRPPLFDERGSRFPI